MIAKLLFWISAGLVFYVYLGYPLLLWFLQVVFRSPSGKKSIEPSVSLLIAAYNEADVIGAKLLNALSLDYPADRLEIVVVSDGSTDATAQIVHSLAQSQGSGRILLYDFPRNRGKVTALNESVPLLRNEIVVFSDAACMLAQDSIRHLVHNFADPKVGAVSGVYRVLKRDQARSGAQEDLYWKYETFLKVQEANLGGYTGAHGSLYAIRKELYPFPAPDTINDDFVIPMRIQQMGFRVAYEPTAVAYEEAGEMEGFSRRVRITAGNFAQLREIKGLLWPPSVVALFCLLSHKAGRLFVPLAMVVIFAANIFLWNLPFYKEVLWLQLAFYGLALLGESMNLRPVFLRLPHYFCMINSALFAWIYQAVRLGRLVPSRIELDRIGDRSSLGQQHPSQDRYSKIG